MGLHIISAMNPKRYADTYDFVWLTVWFKEFDKPFYNFVACPLDSEVHGRELWIRALAGEYGSVEIINRDVTGNEK